MAITCENSANQEKVQNGEKFSIFCKTNNDTTPFYSISHTAKLSGLPLLPKSHLIKSDKQILSQELIPHTQQIFPFFSSAWVSCTQFKVCNFLLSLLLLTFQATSSYGEIYIDINTHTHIYIQKAKAVLIYS